MTIKEILHQAMTEIFRNEIEEGFFLFVRRDIQNMVVGSTTAASGNISVNGQIDSLRDFSQINTESINGMAIISEQVTYWFKIDSPVSFEILSGSNIMGKSTINLLEITRTDSGKWIVESPHSDIVAERLVYKSDTDMVHGIFNILADLGNPYNHLENCKDDSVSSIEYTIKVKEAVLSVNGHDWISFPCF
jgi:hypothetical protein